MGCRCSRVQRHMQISWWTSAAARTRSSLPVLCRCSQPKAKNHGSQSKITSLHQVFRFCVRRHVHGVEITPPAETFPALRHETSCSARWLARTLISAAVKGPTSRLLVSSHVSKQRAERLRCRKTRPSLTFEKIHIYFFTDP